MYKYEGEPIALGSEYRPTAWCGRFESPLLVLGKTRPL